MSADADNRIYVRVVSQVSLTVTGENIFRELQERVLKWGFDPQRNLKGIPDGAWDGETFDIDADNSERAAAIKLDDPKYWAFRLSERLKDTNRIWTTEVGIAELQPNEAAFGCRLVCSHRGMWDAVPRSIPNFVRGIAFTQNARLDGRLTSAEPWIVDSEEAVDELVSFLQAPTRNHPVVVFSLPEDSGDTEETIIPVIPFLRRTVGYVHTVIITSDGSFALTDRLGREFSVYRQAVRTFNPGFQPGSDLSTDHPVATAARIQGWPDTEEGSFTEFLVHQSLRLTRTRDVLERKHPPFHQVKRIAAEQARRIARASGQDDTELLMLAEEELKAAKQEAQTSLEMAIDADAEKEQALTEVQQTKASYMALQARLKGLQAQLAQGEKEDNRIPDSLEDIEKWAVENLSGEVELHEKALKAAKESDFKDTELVYNALLMMRDLYVPMRRDGGIELVNKFDQRLAELGLENSPCFAQDNKAKNFGGAYFVRYQSSKRELDWHLKGSNSRDGRRGFRMYYFWDAESSRVVVGYFPGHLRNDIT